MRLQHRKIGNEGPDVVRDNVDNQSSYSEQSEPDQIVFFQSWTHKTHPNNSTHTHTRRQQSLHSGYLLLLSKTGAASEGGGSFPVALACNSSTLSALSAGMIDGGGCIVGRSCSKEAMMAT